MKSKTGTFEAIQSLLKDNDFFIKKKFGQNFITDSNVLTNIVNVADIKDCDVIEIGPGLGSLTVHLLEQAHKVVAFEIDDDLIPILTNLFKDYDNFDLVHQDILKVDINSELKNILMNQIKIIIIFK